MNDSKPWYRQLWPWLLMIPPLGAVCGGMATIWLAVVSDDGLVNSEYYKDGLAINRIIEKDQRAEALGLSGRAQFNFDDGRVQVLLESGDPGSQPLRLQLLHPTRGRLDQSIELDAAGPMQYVGSLSSMPAGLWYLRLEPIDADWRLGGRLRLPGEVQAPLTPNRS